MGTIVNRGGKFRALVRKAGHPQQSKTFETAKEAKKWIREVEMNLEAIDVSSRRLSLTHLIDRYATEIGPKRQMAASHLAHDIPSIKNRFDGVTLADLHGRGLIDWVLKQTDVSGSTAYWHIARLCGVLKQAEYHWGIDVPWKDIERSKAQLFDGGYLRRPNERNRRVSNVELTAIKSKLAKRFRGHGPALLDFCLWTCMRIGEVCRITWDDLNIENRTVLVRDRKHPTRKFGNHQHVPLLQGSFELLLTLPRQDKRIWPLNPMYVSKVFHDSAVKAGVLDVVLHDLRHEGITRMFEAGFQIHEVALVSGHRDWKMLRRYTHVRPESLIERERQLLAA
jgi:integrase